MTDPESLLADFETKLAETTRKAEQVRAGLDAVSATARSGDGKVVVTVNASGNVVDLMLPDADLAASVLNTIRRAQSRLADAARTTMPAELTGTALMDELDAQYRTAYPEPTPEANRSPRRSLRLGPEDDREVTPDRPAPRRPRPDPGDEPEYGDRTLLR
jgi:glucose/arabinose dehydrogenase